MRREFEHLFGDDHSAEEALMFVYAVSRAVMAGCSVTYRLTRMVWSEDAAAATVRLDADTVVAFAAADGCRNRAENRGWTDVSGTVSPNTSGVFSYTLSGNALV